MAPKKKTITGKTPGNTKTTAKSLAVVSEPVAEILKSKADMFACGKILGV